MHNKRSCTFIFLSLLCASLTGFAQSPSVKRNILYIGNSYTYYNNLPDLVYQLGLTSGDSLFYDSSTPGGYTLSMHCGDAVTLSKINARQWDYVVLQCQSQEPSLDPSSVNINTLPYALQLDSLIGVNNSCTRTVFYETWGRKYGDAQNCSSYPPVCTYTGMQNRLRSSYKIFADTCKGIMAPVGEAFRLSRLMDSTINLYETDLSHPSPAGSYLAACIFYEVFTHRSAIGNPFWGSLPQNTAVFLQNVAQTVLEDSLTIWNFGKYEAWAPFSWQEISPLTMQCTNISVSPYQHFWDFGDAGTSTQQNPLHVYSAPMYYPMYHVVFDGCMTDSFALVNNITGSQSGVLDLNSSLKIKRVDVYDMRGGLVEWFNFEMNYSTLINHSTNQPNLPTGIYLIRYTLEDGSFLIKKEFLNFY
jgi:hypothetical protein